MVQTKFILVSKNYSSPLFCGIKNVILRKLLVETSAFIVGLSQTNPLPQSLS